MRQQSRPSPLPCERSSSSSTYRQSMMPNPEPLTARATSKGKQKLLLTSEHVSWCPPKFVVSVRTCNLSRANELHLNGEEAAELAALSLWIRSATAEPPRRRSYGISPSYFGA